LRRPLRDVDTHSQASQGKEFAQQAKTPKLVAVKE
jgi:hypothetical protein